MAAKNVKDLSKELCVKIPVLETQIPKIGSENREILNNLPNVDEVPLALNMSGSFFGQIIKISYVLQIYVKHDEFGQGPHIKVPIHINQKPLVLYTPYRFGLNELLDVPAT